MEPEVLIDGYMLEVYTPDCDPGAECYSAVARLATDIAPVLPYLNATLRGAMYYHAAQALTWKKAGHAVAFHPHEIATSNVEDREAARREIEGLIELVNRTWARRAEITPDTTTRQRPTPMAVYKLLPHTNCKVCGEATCYNFALKLTAAKRAIHDCPVLQAPEWAEQLAALQAILIDAPAIG
jgi:ArsR family metal-binding transcriptional regulator